MEDGETRTKISTLIENLPCIPDNLAWAPQGATDTGGQSALWVGCASRRARPISVIDVLGGLPSLRRCVGSGRGREEGREG